MSEINVVPLADVSLVLLIILLVLSPMMAQHRLQVQAAAEKADSAAPEPEEAPN
ncbi:MAG: biopolymer transporter ExbD, partial [Elusimicrobia bacterium]|nr:biopolymer transporter ExbD [Elusimicrobiota bacterium]